jgi:hypothetical protein
VEDSLMKELLDALISWPTLIGALVVFSLVPSIVLQVMARIYPHDHPRRRELLAEYAIVPRWERPFWVTEQLVTVTFDGVPARYKARHERHDAMGAAGARTIHRTIVDSAPAEDRIGPWNRMRAQGRSSMIPPAEG